MKPWQCSFTVEGLNLEKLMRRMGEEGVVLSAVTRKGRKLTALVSEDDLPLVQQLAESGGWRFSHGQRQGTGKLVDGLHRRWLLALLSLLGCVGLAVATQVVWRVEVVDAGVYQVDVRQYLQEMNIHPLQWKGSVDTAALRDALEWRYPDVAWVECSWRGMTLQIRLVAGVPSGEAITHDGAGNVVAQRDGVVERIVTLAGTPQVKAGDVVRAGDVLILGQERTSDGDVRAVSARGKVFARVWDQAEVRLSMLEHATTYTGRRQEAYTVALPWFDLWQPEESGFDQQDVSIRTMPLGGFFLPLVYREETRLEASVTPQRRDLEQVKAEAAVAALRKLRQSIGSSDDFLTKWVDYSMIDDENLSAVATGERIVDIAVSAASDSFP